MSTLSMQGSLTGDMAPGISTSTLLTAVGTETDDVVLAIEARARLSIAIPNPIQPKPVLRATMHMSATHDRPAIVRGQPVLSEYAGYTQPSGATVQGSGHIRTFNDPDPVWGGSAWTVAPPDFSDYSSHNFLRWSARSLPNPALYPNGRYSLGTPDAFDGTSGYTGWATQWYSDPGSTVSVPFQSAYPFKPVVTNYVHYGPSGQLHVEDRAVHFDRSRVQHMWADLGTIFDGPFTLMIVAILSEFHHRRGWTYVFDSGVSPLPSLTTAQRQTWERKGVGSGVALNEAQGYRTGLRVSPTAMQMWNDQSPSTRIGKLPYINRYRPHVIALVFDGSNSHFHSLSVNHHRIRNLRLARYTQRNLLLGRAAGHIDPDYASAMAVFEIRAWDIALSTAQIDNQAAQLMTTWKFHAFK